MTLLLTRSVFAQSSGSGEEGEAGATTGIPVPLDPLSLYIQYQSPIIEAAYCLGPQLDLWIFELESSPIEFDLVAGNAGDDQEIAHWRSFSYSEYDWTSGSLDPQTIADLNAISARAAVIAGDFDGPCGTVSCMALWMMYIDDDNNERHFLMPLVQLDSMVSDVMHSMGNPDGPETVDPCATGAPWCLNVWNVQHSSAMSAFVSCSKGTAAAVGLETVACITLCAPLTGSGIGFPACLSGCEAGVLIIGFFDFSTCWKQLNAARIQADAAYDACLNWKCRNCPNDLELYGYSCPP